MSDDITDILRWSPHYQRARIAELEADNERLRGLLRECLLPLKVHAHGLDAEGTRAVTDIYDRVLKEVG